MTGSFKPAGFCWAGLLCLVTTVLKLTGEAQWSWWRVLLPLWVFLGHNILYVAIGFVWLTLKVDGERKKPSQSAKDMAGTVTKSRRWCALSCLRIIC